MSSFRKMAQTIWPCRYRMVRLPGYRYRVLDGQIAIEVEMCIKALSEQKESEILDLNVQFDLVHFLVMVSTKISISGYV